MKFNYVSSNKKKAFTLIELLIVIAIIGILFIVLVSKVDFATDKAKATGVQTDFRSFQMAFDTVAKENAGFNTFGFDTGDNGGGVAANGSITINGKDYTYTNAEKDKGDGKRNSYDEGDINLDGKNVGETWTGRKVYTETWTDVWTLVKPGTSGYNADAIFALESAINKNLDPKLYITIASDGKITMANQARDPWKNEYHGYYITNAETDKGDRGAIVIYSNGANGKWGSAHDITNGVVSVTVPGNNVNGKDDYSLVSCYTFTNGYGEVLNMSTGFSNNQSFMANGSNSTAVVPGGSGTPEEPAPIPVVGSATFADGVTLSWNDLLLPENGEKYDYNASAITDARIGYQAFNQNSNLTCIVIPTGVTSIEDYAFRGCSNLTSVAIPDSVTSIGYSAFNACSSLTNIEIPDSVTNIGSSAFYRCTKLASVTIGNGVTSINSSTFYYCSSLTSVTIGNGVTSIGYSAFYECSSLTNIVIPDGVTNIGEMAFRYCKKLESITIPNSVTVIGDAAFTWVSALKTVYYEGTQDEWSLINIADTNSELLRATIHYQ